MSEFNKEITFSLTYLLTSVSNNFVPIRHIGIRRNGAEPIYYCWQPSSTVISTQFVSCDQVAMVYFGAI